ncbi:MAG: hypothetical protein ABIQ35_03730, partial [Verrucomicrobiota bacterium]
MKRLQAKIFGPVVLMALIWAFFGPGSFGFAETNLPQTVPAIVNTQDPKDVPLSPEAALRKISLPPGFKVNLCAGDPEVEQPIGMALDARGRIWVAENYSYNGASLGFEARHRDRIIVLEDAKGTGRFDKRTVFFDQAFRLTSVEVGFGGVWALCS